VPVGQDIQDITNVDPNIETCYVQATVEWHVGNYMGKRVGGLTNAFYGPTVKRRDRRHADRKTKENPPEPKL
jgi:hypothetical protein